MVIVRDDVVTLYEKETHVDPYFLTHTLSTKLIRRLNTSSIVLSDTPYLRDYEKGFLIMYITKAHIHRVLEKVRPTKHNRFLIVWSSLYSTYQDIDFVLAHFWQRKILNVLVVVDLPEYVHIFTYYPYARENKTKFMNVWDKRKALFTRDQIKIYDILEQTRNLNMHEIKMMVKTRPPDSVIFNSSEGWQLQGSSGEIMKEARRRLNFTPVFTLPVNVTPLDRFGYDISPGIPQQFHQKLRGDEIDMGFGIFAHIIYDSPDVEFARTFVEECFTFSVSSETGIPPSFWSHYVDNFDTWVWACVVGAVGSFVLVWRATNYRVVARHRRRQASAQPRYFQRPHLPRHLRPFQQSSSYDQIFLLALACLLGIPNQPRRSRFVLLLRFLFVIWILFCFIVSAAFQTSLGSLLTVQRQVAQIQTSKGIYAQGIRLLGQPQSRRIMNRSVAPGDPDFTGALVNSFIIHQGYYTEVIDAIHNNPKIGSFSARRYMQFYAAHHPSQITEGPRAAHTYIHIFPSCRLRTQASPFLFKRGAPLAPRLNWLVACLVEGGIVDRWSRDWDPVGRNLERALRDPVSRLELNQLKGALIILAGGLSLGALALIAELWVASFSKVKTKKVVDHKGRYGLRTRYLP